MPKRDEGHEETERLLADLEKRITKEYQQAEKEIQCKLDDYMKRFATKDKIKHQAMLDGKISKEEYQKWLTGQIAMGKRWEEMKDTIAKDLTNASQIAKSITAGYMPEVYAINHNYGTFQVEKESKMDTSYTLYDRDSAERMFKETDFYKKPGKKIQSAINEGKQMAWDKKQIQSVMFQGIVQGESIGQIATRICEKTCDSDRKAAIRNARTVTTGIENVGRVDSYKRAEDMGIKLKQQWVASLDFRTRHEHRVLDGQAVAVGEKFEVEGEEIEYPGDPSAADFLVYNCRCTLIPCLDGFERDLSDTSIRHDSHLGDMSYDEWKESKEVYSDPITKQDDIAQMMKESYIQDYRYLENKNPYLPIDDNSGIMKSPTSGYGKAESVMGEDLVQRSDEYMARMNDDDATKFKRIFAKADYAESDNGSYYSPDDNIIYMDSSNATETTAFHESTHWFDYNQDFKIESDWGHYKYNYDDDGNRIGREWIPMMHTIKEHASFSEYIAWKWDEASGNATESNMALDMKNFIAIVGTSDTYGKDRAPEDVVRDLSAINQYLDSKGISKTDPDYIHLSDFISAITYDSSLGSLTTGGHDYDYWVSKPDHRVAEITAGYNLLKATGRTDLIDVEKELAPNLMKMIEKEWKKIW